ncbi:hypothetical protein Tco_1567937, partial [Tanacetum coccineum]
MKHQVIYVAIMATLVLFLLSFKPTGASRILDGDFEETWMKRSDLLLSSLQRKPPVRSPGNRCNSTGNGCVWRCMAPEGCGRPNAATAPSLTRILSNSLKLDDDVEKDIEDCSNNATEKCGVVNNNMSNNVEGEILEDHFDG